MISALDLDYEPMLVGTLIITNSNSEGETTSLTDKDIEHIKNYIVHYQKGNILHATALYAVEY